MNTVKLWFNLLLLFSIVLIISCKYKYDKQSLLIDKNNSLNAAFSNKNWGVIYNLKYEASKKGIGPVGWYKNWRESTFVNMYKNHYFYSKITIKNLSYSIVDDSAETKNYIEILAIPTIHVYQDTTFHYWIYKDNNWYLKNWDVRLKSVENEIPDSVFNSLLKKIQNY